MPEIFFHVSGSFLKGRSLFRTMNWWCNKKMNRDIDFFGTDQNYRNPGGLNQFLSEEQIEQARLENETIYNIVAANFLAGTITDYASKYLYDSRVPEALHLAIDATHYSQCQDEKTTDFSRKAFQILHNNYPSSYWAKETPYWY